jgi:hypothetical protein
MIEVCSYCGRQLVPLDNEYPDASLKICPVCLMASLKKSLNIDTTCFSNLMRSMPDPQVLDYGACPLSDRCNTVGELENDLDIMQDRELDLEDKLDEARSEAEELAQKIEDSKAYIDVAEERNQLRDRVAKIDAERAELQAEKVRLRGEISMLQRLVMWNPRVRVPTPPETEPGYEDYDSLPF